VIISTVEAVFGVVEFLIQAVTHVDLSEYGLRDRVADAETEEGQSLPLSLFVKEVGHRKGQGIFDRLRSGRLENVT
jgi:hypothetical protein